MIFQSTLPAWGATWCGSTGKSSAVFQSTLPVWGATGYPVLLFFQFEFQSTLPVWGATASCMFWHRLTYISIHAPRVGSDIWKPWTSLPTPYFNPRSPCGERHGIAAAPESRRGFQSTLPVWGATAASASASWGRAISIHAPRVGSDLALVEFAAIKPHISIHAPRVGSDHRPHRPYTSGL